MKNEEDEAITLPLYSGPALYDLGKSANSPRPQRPPTIRHHGVRDNSPFPHARRATATTPSLASLLNLTGLELFTVDEAAALLRTSRKAIYAMAERHQLPGATRIGRRLLVRRDDLLSWLDERRATSPGGTRR
jgi:excisionase family DNA binding protein